MSVSYTFYIFEMGDMAPDQINLFRHPGHISLREYLSDIKSMEHHGPWKLPLEWSEYWRFFLLSFIEKKLTKHLGELSILHPYSWSPSYNILFSYLHREGFFDRVYESPVPIRGLYAYRLVRKERRLPEGTTPRINAGGVASSREIALSKAIGEIIERNVAGFHDDNKVVTKASPETLLRTPIHIYYPPQFHQYLPIQIERFKSLRHDPNKPMEWVSGLEISSGKVILIPRQITSWGHMAHYRKTEGLFYQPTSNGNAGFFTRAGATLRGLYEVVHRDAFLVHWLTRTTPPRIDTESLPDDLRETITRSRERGLHLSLLNVTDLPIPSVIVAVINKNAKIPQVVLTGAAAANFHDAIRSALEEIPIVTWRMETEPLPENIRIDEPEPFVSNLGHSSRQDYWRGEERVRKFQWFLSGRIVKYSELCQTDLTLETDESVQLDHCLDVLRSFGPDYNPLVYYPQHPVLKQLGYAVAQVIIPKAFPLFLTEYMGSFESDRLKDFTASRGMSVWHLNQEPHMFS